MNKIIIALLLCFIGCNERKIYNGEPVDVLEQQAIEQYQIDSAKRVEIKRLSFDKSKRLTLRH